jgi:hypothetical protein
VAIYQYSRQFWFPSGVLSANLPARVFPLNSNALAPLWTDATGTVALPNPLTTDINGTVAFYAEEGEYWIHIDAEAFRVSVGSPDVDLFEVQAGDMSTGIIAGGELNVNGSNPQAIDIGALTGYIVDEITDPRSPAVTRVNTAGSTVALSGSSLTRVVTWWIMDSAGTVIQQAARPSNTQRRTHLVLGVTAYDSGSLTIFADQTLPVILAQPANQLADLMDALGPFSMEGNMITPGGTGLTLAKSAGTVFVRAFNHFSGATPTRDPHVNQSAAQSPVTFRRLLQVAQFPLPAPVTTLDPGQYESAPGVLSPVTGNDATIQRVWLFAANTTANQIVVQYGQHLYPDFTSAVDAIGSGVFVPNPTTAQNAALIAHIIVRGNATNLSDQAQCIMKRAKKLDFA